MRVCRKLKIKKKGQGMNGHEVRRQRRNKKMYLCGNI